MQKTAMRPVRASVDNLDAGVLPETDVVVTYAADLVRRHRIAGVAWSYDITPAITGTLSVEDGSGNVVFSVDVTAGGPGFIPFDPPIEGSVNTAMIVTLSSGGAATVGKINALGYRKE